MSVRTLSSFSVQVSVTTVTFDLGAVVANETIKRVRYWGMVYLDSYHQANTTVGWPGAPVNHLLGIGVYTGGPTHITEANAGTGTYITSGPLPVRAMSQAQILASGNNVWSREYAFYWDETIDRTVNANSTLYGAYNFVGSAFYGVNAFVYFGIKADISTPQLPMHARRHVHPRVRSRYRRCRPSPGPHAARRPIDQPACSSTVGAARV